MNKRVTVYDIAARLNISPSTVSRVLNNSTLISDERTDQILQTARQMGYKRRTVKKHVSRAILNIHLFLPEASSTLIHFFYNISELLDAIQEGFGPVKLNISTRINDGNIDFLSFKKTGQIDGCIFAFTIPRPELAAALQEKDIPLILLNREHADFSCVYYDTRLGMQLLAEKVIAVRGPAIRPCFIGFRGLEELSTQRFLGAQDKFAEHGIQFDQSNLYLVDDLGTISETVPPWVIRNGFNTILAFNDIVAISLLESLIARGMKIPEDISLTGFDNSPVLHLMDRMIDTISLSIPELGRSAGTWLNSVIIEKRDDSLHLRMPVEYIPGMTL